MVSQIQCHSKVEPLHLGQALEVGLPAILPAEALLAQMQEGPIQHLEEGLAQHLEEGLAQHLEPLRCLEQEAVLGSVLN